MPTDKQKLIASIQAVADAVKSGNGTLIQFSGQLLEAQLATLPDNWTEKHEPQPTETAP